MTIFSFNNRQLHITFWTPAHGVVGTSVAVDTETDLIKPGQVAPFVIGQAYAGGDTVFLLRAEHVRAFLDLHAAGTLLFHSAAFDMAVLELETGFNFDAQLRGQRLFDVAVLYRLLKLATEGQSPRKWSLALVARELLGVALDKDDCLRLQFGKYRRGTLVDYSSMSDDLLIYAAKDSVATYDVYVLLRQLIAAMDCRFLLSHKITLMGAWALARTSTRGLRLDVNAARRMAKKMDRTLFLTKSFLARHGYIPGQPGNTNVLLTRIKELGIELPLTEGGRQSTKAKHLKRHIRHKFIRAYLLYLQTKKLRDVFGSMKGPRVHTSYDWLLNSGRTSSSKPNIQNLPRRRGIRECFIPTDGHCFLIIDYKQIELVALAQVCLDLFGKSRMAELINQGADLHRWFASVLTGKATTGVTDEERQFAKAANFGFPGGLGVDRFVDYALDTWGVSMTKERAKTLRQKWLEAFPEMRLYLSDALVKKVAPLKPSWCRTPEQAAWLFKRVISGARSTKRGEPYDRKTLDWAFNKVLPIVAPHRAGVRVGSSSFLEEICREDVETRTGRIRARASYCQAKNTRFQGLAADGAKLGLYRLERADYRVVNFVHDEYVIEVPLTSDLMAAGENIRRIVCAAMSDVIPDVNVEAEWTVADRWYKNARRITDSQGRIAIYTEAKRHRVSNVDQPTPVRGHQGGKDAQAIL